MSYLPHLSLDRMNPTIAAIERALEGKVNDFDTVLVTGLSGIVPAAIICHKYQKAMAILRKDQDASVHGWPLEAPYNFHNDNHRYIIIDDFTASGATMTRLLDVHRMPPKFVILYSPAREAVCPNPEYTKGHKYMLKQIGPFLYTAERNPAWRPDSSSSEAQSVLM